MAKTFYTVTYAVWGAGMLYTKIFDNKAKAEEFAAKDYCDMPVRHTLRNLNSIAEWEEMLKEQERAELF